MTASDFRRIALSLEGAEEGSHMGSPDFRVGGRIFATLASQSQGYGNLVLTSEQQAEFSVAGQLHEVEPFAGMNQAAEKGLPRTAPSRSRLGNLLRNRENASEPRA